MALYDAALARWPVPCERLTISTRHGDTFVIASGEPTAPPLILLHGAGTNSAIWIGDVGVLSRRYRVYAVDLIGEAGKSAPSRPDWNGPAYAEWLCDVFNALKIEQAALVGISQGAWTALKFATGAPERVTRLVLLTPGGIVPDKLSFLLRAIPLSILGRWGAERLSQAIYGNQPIPDGALDITVTVMSHFKARVGVLPIFTDEELHRLTMPTLLLGGTADVLRDIPKIAARLNKLLPNLTVTIIPQAGHALLNTTDQVVGFLSA
ncbi:MAG: alpha/beta hydrolase [Anaerolineae bacterium]|nr:alpha/beta hydrolase [Anaerolineae bacterium]